ncbi:hypothetical protein L3Q82_002226 [Scortum barcoo]|uniref:Uncharacterized protein n=1 Tax=Scortum barcoo TaxID=214431 RepID=A0ACB8W530_9TELE|nr:hypothetical protein L3Q82_002226 [Scortum barcoo]
MLTLLPKKGDLQDIKNWRPVSLLCTDYKLLSKVLANRLRKVMDQLPGGLEWKRGGFKYLGIHLGDDETVKKNWEGVVEKMEVAVTSDVR